jgi:hypothetical protein
MKDKFPKKSTFFLLKIFESIILTCLENGLTMYKLFIKWHSVLITYTDSVFNKF